MRLVVVAALLVSVDAWAVPVCTADEVCDLSQTSCVIDTPVEVGPGCTLDFGDLDVELTATGSIDAQVGGDSIDLYAGSFDLFGTITSRDDMPGGYGGDISIAAQRSIILHGLVDASGTAGGGGIGLMASGDVRVTGGTLRAIGLDPDSDPGLLFLVADGEVWVEGEVELSGTQGRRGGLFDVYGEIGVTLLAPLDLSGTEAGGEAYLSSVGDVGLHGLVDVSGGQLGGFIDISSEAAIRGEVDLIADSEASAGGVSLWGLEVDLGGTVSASGVAPGAAGGALDLAADGDLRLNHVVASGVSGGGDLTLYAGRDMRIDGELDISSDDQAGFLYLWADRKLDLYGDVLADAPGLNGAGGASITMRADNGIIRVWGRVLARGDEQGDGGTILAESCGLRVGPDGSLNTARGAGINDLRIRQDILIEGNLIAGTDNLITMRWLPPDLRGVARPAPYMVWDADMPLCACDDSDVDLVCDVDDVCPGGDDTIDVDGDGLPDACEQLSLTPPVSPTLRGTSPYEIHNAPPGATVYLIHGSGAGPTAVPGCRTGVGFDVTGSLGNAVVDAQGQATIDAQLRRSMAGDYVIAVVISACEVSNRTRL